MKIAITASDRRFLVLLLMFWFVWSQAAHIGDFFAGLYDGAGGLPSQSR